MHYNSHTATDDKSKASLFNEYFESVYSRNKTFMVPTNGSTNEDCLYDVAITPEEVYSALISLNVNKASGCDKISPKVIRGCALSLYKPLHYLSLFVFLSVYCHSNGKSTVLYLFSRVEIELRSRIIDLYQSSASSPKFSNALYLTKSTHLS